MGVAKLWNPCYKIVSEVGKTKWMQISAVFMKSSAKIHLVCQIGLGKPLWARVFRACCCNSDNCVRYCDTEFSAIVYIFLSSCNSDNCVRYCDSSIILPPWINSSGCNSDICVRYCDSSLSKPPYVISVATAITASGIVTDYFQHNMKFDVQLQEWLLQAVIKMKTRRNDFPLGDLSLRLFVSQAFWNDFA